MPGTLVSASLLFCVVFTSPVCAGQAVAEAPLNIIGGLDASASVTSQAGAVRVEGQLKDDRGIPRAGHVIVEGASPLLWQDCLLEPATSRGGSATHKPFPTDSDGRFCLQALGRPVSKLTVLARSPEHETTRLVLRSTARHRLAPRIVRAPEMLTAGSSDREEVEALLVAGSGETAKQIRAALFLTCSHQTQMLAIASGDVGSLLQFSFTTRTVDKVGRCEFLVSEEPPPNPTPSDHTSEVGGTSRGVLVRAPSQLAVERQLNDRHGNCHILVKAELPPGLAPTAMSGLLQATSDDVFAGSCPLHDGRCELVIEARSDERRVEIRLVPNSPEILAGAPLIATIPARPPSSLPFVLQSVLLAGFASWLVYAWLGRRSFVHEGPLLPLGSAGVSQEGAPGRELAGIVLDAHTGEPVPDAIIELIAVQPLQQTVIEVGRTRSGGAFSLTTQPASHLLRVRVHKTGYLPMEALVQGSRLLVQITAHRRALIGSLLRWAKAEGMALRPRVPGPHEIAVYAELGNTEGRGQWVRAVERAAYGREAPAESDVTELSERQRR